MVRRLSSRFAFVVITALILSLLGMAPASAATFSEQQGSRGVNTFFNYHNASGMGPRVNPGAWVDVSCKVYDPYIGTANPDGYWYRIASAPWNDQYYAPANTFMNGDPWGGPYTHNTDFNVPDCGAAPTPTPAPSVTLSQGPAAPAGYRYAVTLNNFAANSSVLINCFDSVSPGGFYTFTLATDASGSASTASQCYSGDGPDHWVVANGVESNHASWGAAPAPNPAPVPVPDPGTGHTVINGIDVGVAQNQPHAWGPCTVQDFRGGPHGWVIVSYTNGTHLVRNGMLSGWFDNGGAPGLGCPTNDEHSYANGVRQDFTGGGLYWVGGMNHAKRITWTDTPSSTWAGYVGHSTAVESVSTSITVPTVFCTTSGLDTHFSAWAGIGGWQRGDSLVQAGILAKCDGTHSSANYQLFWQKVPFGDGKSKSIAAVHPGQVVDVTIQWFIDNTYRVAATVDGRSYPVRAGRYVGGNDLSAKHVTAECIAEAPITATGGHPLPLAKFEPVTFNSCQMASFGGSRYAITDAPQHGSLLERSNMHVGHVRAGRLRATTGLAVDPAGPWQVFYASN